MRILFRLDVRDTQVGLKLFRREIAEEVMPLLLVKRYAFDLELLAVSRSLGFARIEEQPVRLDYRFTGSGIGSVAVLRALVDTAAIFYRLRILRYYARKRRLLGDGGYERSLEFAPLVSVVGDPGAATPLDYPKLELVPLDPGPRGRVEAARAARGDVLAFLAEGAVPAGNWVSSGVQFLGRPDIAAVVAPTMTPAGGSVRERATAAVSESRLAGGSRSICFRPGNLRFVRSFPAASVIVRRQEFLDACGAGGAAERLCEELDRRGKNVVYTPETMVVEHRPGSIGTHLRDAARSGAEDGGAVRRRGLHALQASMIASLLLVPGLAAAGWLAAEEGSPRDVGIALLAAYAAAVLGSGVVAALRFRSLAVGALALSILPPTQLAYAGGFLAGLARPA